MGNRRVEANIAKFSMENGEIYPPINSGKSNDSGNAYGSFCEDRMEIFQGGPGKQRKTGDGGKIIEVKSNTSDSMNSMIKFLLEEQWTSKPLGPFILVCGLKSAEVELENADVVKQFMTSSP
ncbi:hypothetical protein L1987_01140 [Smallanthus sonchifolius]|uniref:Uncharacterized protein n=1 Tax=Smallanthus sonchifolius TaxID=185202 RepID=A0ACB9K492_9ASTR|nr:hypothetical protein L1987_01140 [Smallanthus sonchifolius]